MFVIIERSLITDFVIIECSLTTEFVITEFHCISIFYKLLSIEEFSLDQFEFETPALKVLARRGIMMLRL